MDAIYTRQSLDKKDSLSIEGQVEQCKKFAGEDYKVFSDKGYSGKNINRPAFKELMQDVEAGRIKKIYVYRLDRFSRSIADFSRLWETLEQKGVAFQSVTENFDTSTPIGRAMLNIVLVFAQLERETTAERVKDNYVHRFRLGAWPGGPAPYGFSLTKILDNSRKVSSLVPNENAEVVKLIFNEYNKPEASLRGLAKWLTEQGIHGPKREAWDNVTLSRLLHSPLYVMADEDVYWHFLSKGLQMQQDIEAFDGVHACNLIGRRDRTKNKYSSVEGQMLTVANHKGYIDSSLWLSVQDKLSNNKQLSRKNAGKYSWLTGLMKCEKCGYAIKINYIKSEERCQLVCSGHSNFSICKGSIAVNLKDLEEYVENQIITILKESPPEEMIPADEEISAEVLSIEQKIERLVNALAESSNIAAGYISKQIDGLHKKREELMMHSPKELPKPEKLDFSKLSFEEKKLIAAEFIEKILLYENSVNILWKI